MAAKRKDARDMPGLSTDQLKNALAAKTSDEPYKSKLYKKIHNFYESLLPKNGQFQKVDLQKGVRLYEDVEDDMFRVGEIPLFTAFWSTVEKDYETSNPKLSVLKVSDQLSGFITDYDKKYTPMTKKEVSELRKKKEKEEEEKQRAAELLVLEIKKKEREEKERQELELYNKLSPAEKRAFDIQKELEAAQREEEVARQGFAKKVIIFNGRVEEIEQYSGVAKDNANLIILGKTVNYLLAPADYVLDPDDKDSIREFKLKAQSWRVAYYLAHGNSIDPEEKHYMVDPAAPSFIDATIQYILSIGSPAPPPPPPPPPGFFGGNSPSLLPISNPSRTAHLGGIHAGVSLKSSTIPRNTSSPGWTQPKPPAANANPPASTAPSNSSPTSIRRQPSAPLVPESLASFVLAHLNH